MINSLLKSLIRVTGFWYVLGLLVMFFGDPGWAESVYRRLAILPWVPTLEMTGITSAASVQLHLLVYWTFPVALVWGLAILAGFTVAEIRCRLTLKNQLLRLKPSGEFWGVTVAKYSLGELPAATTPKPIPCKVAIVTDNTPPEKNIVAISVHGAMKEAMKVLTATEKHLCEELIQVLLTKPDQFAGLGHGVGLLEHTLNVATEAATKCTPDFRLPLIAALAHDIGKLITFKPDGQGGWRRQGLHSREGARILATLASFRELPEIHQRGLLLAVKYDHAPNKIPTLREDPQASQLAMRIISALAHADRTATAAEKDRNLEKLRPEDLLWKDFVDNLRNAPVAQMGKKGAENQVNNPSNSPYLYIYEAAWRDAAVKRLPPEVAAALDLTRRDTGQLAKYTKFLIERLRTEGLLVETIDDVTVHPNNPLWNIKSGTGEKGKQFNGVIVLHATPLWTKLNYQLGKKSPFPVSIVGPNADADGHVHRRHHTSVMQEEQPTPEISDGLKVTDTSAAGLQTIGLATDASADTQAAAKPKVKSRSHFKPEPPKVEQDQTFGLDAPEASAKRKKKDVEAPLSRENNTIVSVVEVVPVDESKVTPGNISTEAPQLFETGSSLLATPDESSTLALELFNTLQTPEVLSDLLPSVDLPQSAEAILPNHVEGPATRKPSVQQEKRKREETHPEPNDGQTAKAKSRSEKQPLPETTVPGRPKPTAKPGGSQLSEAGSPDAAGLSRAEKRAGLAIADDEALLKYPHLVRGQKYYTEQADAVKDGYTKPGDKYQGETKNKTWGLNDSGPRRARRTQNTSNTN